MLLTLSSILFILCHMSQDKSLFNFLLRPFIQIVIWTFLLFFSLILLYIDKVLFFYDTQVKLQTVRDHIIDNFSDKREKAVQFFLTLSSVKDFRQKTLRLWFQPFDLISFCFDWNSILQKKSSWKFARLQPFIGSNLKYQLQLIFRNASWNILNTNRNFLISRSQIFLEEISKYSKPIGLNSLVVFG